MNENDEVTSEGLTFRLRWYNHLGRLIGRPLFKLIFYILSPITITGRENIPRDGAYLIAFNHISLYEAPFIVCFWNKAPEVLGAIEVWSRKGQDFFAHMYGGVQIHRGQYDRKALELGLGILESGKPMIIAPEGGRGHKPGLRKAFPGIAYLVEKTGVLVVPVGVVGTTDDYLHRALRMQRPRLEMHIGKPISLHPVSGVGEARRAARQANADLIMQEISALLPEDYRGVYSPV